MLRVVVEIWLAGSALIGLMFLFVLYGPDRQMNDEFAEAFAFIRQIAPGYILLWPWRILVWPVLRLVQQRCHTDHN